VATTGPLTCPSCRSVLLEALPPLGNPRPCPYCEKPLEGLVFTAFHRPISTGKAAEAVVTVEEAACFYHPQSRATVPCDICGRFLCSLCDVEMHGQHVCPPCLNSGRKKQKISNVDGDRILYGGIAFLVAVVPLFSVYFLTFITAPLAIFVAIFGWRKPRSLVGTGNIRFYVAILIALVQIAVWIWLAIALFWKNPADAVSPL
jgi:hypothetical protein